MHSRHLNRQMVALLPRLRRFARSLSGNPSDADDLVQEACARAMTKLHRLRQGARLDAWMFTILREAWISEARRATTRRLASTVDATESDERRHDADGASELVAGAVRDAILALPPGLTSVILLVCIEGYSYRDAADMLDVPIGTATSRMSRARQTLAAGLTAEGVGIPG